MDNLKQLVDKELFLFFENKKNYYDKEIFQELRNFTMSGGKRIRPILMYYGYLAGGGKNKKEILKTACSLELTHSYLLIHDDIIDKDKLRRNKKTVWHQYAQREGDIHYGCSKAIVAGDLASAWALESLLKSKFDLKNKLKALECYARMLSDVNYGQALDIQKKDPQKFREKDVLEIHKYKTAKYTIEAPLVMGAILAGGRKDLINKISEYAIAVGIAFQIKDDILGVFGSVRETGKPIGSDLQEGKKTLLIVKTLEKANYTQKKFLLNILGSKKISQLDLQRARLIIEKTGSLKYSQDLAKNLVEKGKTSINSKLFKKSVIIFLSDLADYIVKRKK